MSSLCHYNDVYDVIQCSEQMIGNTHKHGTMITTRQVVSDGMNDVIVGRWNE